MEAMSQARARPVEYPESDGHLAGARAPLGPRGRLASEVLGLELEAGDRQLRFFRPGAEAPLLRRLEQVQTERTRAQQERARADAAEAEVRRLREELERLRRA